jgi:hypothetical protein
LAQQRRGAASRGAAPGPISVGADHRVLPVTRIVSLLLLILLLDGLKTR